VPARIVIVLPGLSAGGSERAVSLIASNWAARGCQVTIVTFEDDDTEPYHALSADVDIVRLAIPSDRKHPIRATVNVVRRVLRLRRAFRRLAPDLVISFLTRTNVISVLAATGLSIPVVVSERNNPELQHFGRIWSALRRFAYQRAFGLVTMTKGAMEHFPAEQRRRSWVIPNDATLPTNIRKRSGHKTITAVGRLVPQKGFDLLIDSFALLSDAHPDWKLVIWGEGEQRRELENQRERLNLTHRVELPGVTSRPGLWIETSGIFVLSSRFEGWGIVLLEAMSAGLPVVSFDCKYGPSDMITDGFDGLLVPRGQTKEMAAAISRLIEDSDMRDRLAQNAVVSARRFSREHVMEGWDEVLESALPAQLRHAPNGS